MFEPIRGGTRGGQAEFKWSDVSADKDREVCVFPPVPLIGSTSPALYRITWAIASTPLQAGGRKIRTFIGTIANYKEHQTSVRRKFVKSRKQRQRHSPLHCMTYLCHPFLPLPGYLLPPIQRFRTIQEGIIVKHTRHGYKCYPNPPISGDQCACRPR